MSELGQWAHEQQSCMLDLRRFDRATKITLSQERGPTRRLRGYRRQNDDSLREKKDTKYKHRGRDAHAFLRRATRVTVVATSCENETSRE